MSLLDRILAYCTKLKLDSESRCLGITMINLAGDRPWVLFVPVMQVCRLKPVSLLFQKSHFITYCQGSTKCCTFPLEESCIWCLAR